MPSQNRIGSGVSAAIGPFIENDNLTQETISSANNQQKPQRKRTRYSGIVLGSVSERKWRVYWEDTSQTSIHSTTKLKYIGPRSIPAHLQHMMVNRSSNQSIQYSQSQEILCETSDTNCPNEFSQSQMLLPETTTTNQFLQNSQSQIDFNKSTTESQATNLSQGQIPISENITTHQQGQNNQN